MSRYKAIIGSGLRARTLPAQKIEAKVACLVLNRMTKLGMPAAQRIVRNSPGQAQYDRHPNCAPTPRLTVLSTIALIRLSER